MELTIMNKEAHMKLNGNSLSKLSKKHKFRFKEAIVFIYNITPTPGQNHSLYEFVTDKKDERLSLLLDRVLVDWYYKDTNTLSVFGGYESTDEILCISRQSEDTILNGLIQLIEIIESGECDIYL